MDLGRDEFVVNYDASRATNSDLVATIKQEGFTARVEATAQAVEGPPFFREALAKARGETKPIVVDFTAPWCAHASGCFVKRSPTKRYFDLQAMDPVSYLA